MYLVSYDISDNKCRNKVAKVLEGYGKRVQYSVFECLLSVEMYHRLLEELTKLMEAQEEGNIRVYYICENCRNRKVVIGIEEPVPAGEEDGVFVI